MSIVIPENVIKEPPFAVQTSKIDFQSIRVVLQNVEKPGRYIGSEFGIPKKQVTSSQTRALMIYPDTYELGMSNQGLKILYDKINSLEYGFADRFFIPMQDFVDAMQAEGLPFYSLDQYLDIRSFDFWAINTSTELLYTNILYCLRLANIPLERSKRQENDPLIFTGGTAVSNPFPLFDILDGVFMGDGEESVVEIYDQITECKQEGRSRTEILKHLGENVEGLFVPQEYTILDKGMRQYPEYHGKEIHKRDYKTHIYGNLNHIVVPNIDIIQNRVVVEVTRGCGQGCRFCHAGFWKRPVRNSTVTEIVKSAGRMLAHTGEDSVSLHALSIADYPYLEELVVEMANTYGPRGISISLPSLRVQAKTIPVLEMTSPIRKSSITFALEAGSELQREMIRKNASEENLHYLINQVFSRGWDLVKVYFMMGLPDQNGNEVNDLIRALNALADIAHNAGNRKKINVTVSLYVPKPFTTFQWEAQAKPEYFLDGLKRIKAEVKSRRISIKGPSPYMPYVEGLFSRSDHRMGQWLLEAFESGAKMDCWDENFNWRLWQQIIDQIPEELLELWLGKKEPGSVLPWNELVVPKGAKTDILMRDYEKFQKVNPDELKGVSRQRLENSRFPEELLKPVHIKEEYFKTQKILCLEYEKKGPAIYVSHLETCESIRRACRRVAMPMAFSVGFNKHEKLHFLESLPLYFHSECEVIFIEMYADMDLVAMKNNLQYKLQAGIHIKKLKWIESLPSHKQINESTRKYRLEFKDKALKENIYELLKNTDESFVFLKQERKKKRLKKIPTAQKGMKQVERKLGSALQLAEHDDTSIAFLLDSPVTGAISVSDLLLHYLKIPSNRWNIDMTITRVSM